MEPNRKVPLATAIDELVEVGERVDLRLRRRSRWFFATIALVVLVGGVALAYQSQETARLHRIIDKDCGSFEALATIPLPADPNRVLVKIVNANRQAYNNRCTGVNGPLPPIQTASTTPTLTPPSTRPVPTPTPAGSTGG